MSKSSIIKLETRNEYILSIIDDLSKTIGQEVATKYFKKGYTEDELYEDITDIFMDSLDIKTQAKKYKEASYFDADYTYKQFLSDCSSLLSEKQIDLENQDFIPESYIINILNNAYESLKEEVNYAEPEYA